MCEDLFDALDALAPERFEIVDQAMGGPQRRDVGVRGGVVSPCPGELIPSKTKLREHTR